MNISMSALSKLFPRDTLWTTNGLEIVGYSYEENRHIVIEDGLCNSSDGIYVVHEYKPLCKDLHRKVWNAGKYPFKFLVDEPKIREELVNFNARKEK